MKCEKCGTDLENDMEFCYKCGKFQFTELGLAKLQEEKDKLSRDELIELVNEYENFVYAKIFFEEVKVFEKIYSAEEMKKIFYFNMYRYVYTHYDNSVRTQLYFENFIDIYEDVEIIDFLSLFKELINKNYDTDNAEIFKKSVNKFIKQYNEFMKLEKKFEINMQLNSTDEINNKESRKLSVMYILVPLVLTIWFFYLGVVDGEFLYFLFAGIAFIYLLMNIGKVQRTCPKCKKFDSMRDIETEILDKNIASETEYYYDSNGTRRSRLVTYEVLDLRVTMCCQNCGYEKIEDRRQKNRI